MAKLNTILRGLLGRAATTEPAPVAEVVMDMQAAAKELHAAQQAVQAAENEYSRGLLDVSADVVALDAARRVAAVRLDQAQALCRAFSEKEVEARARDAEFARVERYEAARVQADDARRSLLELYPQLASDLVSLLRIAAEAELAVAAVNADLPRNAIPLARVEAMVRDVPGTPREVVTEVEVERWCRAGKQFPDGLDQRQVHVGERGRGYLRPPTGQTETVYLRRFREQRIALAGQHHTAYRLASRLALPGLLATDPDIWSPIDSLWPNDVLKHASHLAGRPRYEPPAAQINTKLVPIDPFDASAELLNTT